MTARLLAVTGVLGLAAGLVGCGAGSDGELVLFADLGTARDASGPRPGAVELTDAAGFDALGLSGPSAVPGNPELPDLDGDQRRFAFVLSGCQQTSAELEVADGVAQARLTGAEDVACDQADQYLAVFDVPAADVEGGVVLR